jgi:hypothetical protein
LLLEEVDFFPVHTSTSRRYVDFMTALTANVVRASGRDCFWARALPGLVAGMGLRQVGGEGDLSVLQGGSPVAEFFCLTAEQMRERIIESRELSADRLDEALGLLRSPDFLGVRRRWCGRLGSTHKLAHRGGRLDGARLGWAPASIIGGSISIKA